MLRPFMYALWWWCWDMMLAPRVQLYLQTQLLVGSVWIGSGFAWLRTTAYQPSLGKASGVRVSKVPPFPFPIFQQMASSPSSPSKQLQMRETRQQGKG